MSKTLALAQTMAEELSHEIFALVNIPRVFRCPPLRPSRKLLVVIRAESIVLRRGRIVARPTIQQLHSQLLDDSIHLRGTAVRLANDFTLPVEPTCKAGSRSELFCFLAFGPKNDVEKVRRRTLFRVDRLRFRGIGVTGAGGGATETVLQASTCGELADVDTFAPSRSVRVVGRKILSLPVSICRKTYIAACGSLYGGSQEYSPLELLDSLELLVFAFVDLHVELHSRGRRSRASDSFWPTHDYLTNEWFEEHDKSSKNIRKWVIGDICSLHPVRKALVCK